MVLYKSKKARRLDRTSKRIALGWLKGKAIGMLMLLRRRNIMIKYRRR